jgi:phage recombination protein Bet
VSTLQKYEDSEDFSKQLELWTRTFMKGASADEVALFANVCRRTGLSPEMKQIYPIPRKDWKTGITTFSFQTSIDGFRLIAERTGRYAPGRQATYEYNEEKQVISATAYVKKMTNDGTWHEVAVTAFYEEYVQEFKDKETGKFKATEFWASKPHIMLAKCAESLALRKAFPAELSGLYTQEEMAQAHKEEERPKNQTISPEQVIQIEAFLEHRPDLKAKLFKWAQIENVCELTSEKYAPTIKAIDQHLAQEE